MADLSVKERDKKPSQAKPKQSCNGMVQNGMLKSRLGDASLYSYAALCVVSLRRLYADEEWHRDFSQQMMKLIMDHLDQPKQVRESMVAILGGVGIDDVDPFVSVLLDDPALHQSGLPVVFDLLSLAINNGTYDSRMRVLVKRVAWFLHVKWENVENLEFSVVENLTTQQYTMSEEEEKEKAKQARKQKVKRIALIGLATIGGGTLIGLTGGLAAPLVAAGAGAIIGGAGAAALGSVAGVAIIGSLFGVAGAGLTGYKMRKRVGAVEEFEFERLIHSTGKLQAEISSSRQLHITIAITGWLTNEMKDVKKPWQCLADSREQYCLRWETEHLLAFGTAFDYILNAAMSVAAQEALKYTVLSGLISAIMWPAALVSAASVIDNPWSVCIQRATSAGKQLAEVLLAREQGHRPVTLIGYSLGARVIFYCLEELSKRKGSEGIVEDVILLGAPVSGHVKNWQRLDRVVAGKIINGYCSGDWLLKFLYRTASVQLSIAGLRAVRWENRRMCNIDLSDVVTGHMDYMVKLEEILNIIGVRTHKHESDHARPKVIGNLRSISGLSCSAADTKKDSGRLGSDITMDSLGENFTVTSGETLTEVSGEAHQGSSPHIMSDHSSLVASDTPGHSSSVENSGHSLQDADTIPACKQHPHLAGNK